MARTILYIYTLVLCASISAQIFGVPKQGKEKDGTDTAGDNSVDPKKDVPNQEQDVKNIPEINVSVDKKSDNKNEKKTGDTTLVDKQKVDDKNSKNMSSKGNLTTPKVLENSPDLKNNPDAEIESGAVMRGIFVFVGLTMLFIMYVAFKTYRRRNKKNVLIKKYGVRTRRSDMEMEPLPLDEDEDDETVFDLGNVNNR